MQRNFYERPMKEETKITVYKWVSYVLILAATVVFFITKNVDITLLVLVVAVYAHALMYRCKYNSCIQENEELKSDLRRLTSLLQSKSNTEKANN